MIPWYLPSRYWHFEKEMSEAGVDWQMHVYGGTKHAFTNPLANDPEAGIAYNASAKDRAYQAQCRIFCRRYFRASPDD